MGNYVINAVTRTTTGKAAAKRMRAAGHLPAVVYNSKGEAVMLDIDEIEFNKVWRSITPTTSIELKIDGGAAKIALIKDAEYDIKTDSVLHADFFEPASDDKLKAVMKVHIVGTAAGVLKGGFLLKHVPEVTIMASIKDMPATIELDVSALNVGDELKVKDLKLSKGISVLTNEELPLVSVSPAR